MRNTINAQENYFIRHATGIAITVITIIMGLFVMVFYDQSKASNAAKDLVVHTYEVTGHIQLLFNRLKDAELGQRGFIISGNKLSLAPYYDALKDTSSDTLTSARIEQRHSILQEIEILRGLTRDNPTQLNNIDNMAFHINELLAHWKHTIDMRQTMSHSEFVAAYDFKRGKAMMDQMRRLFSLMQAEENRLLDIRTQADEKSTYFYSLIVFCSLGLFYVMKVGAIWFYQRNRAEARAQLLRYTHELEQREEELKLQQEELKASNEEIESSNEELEEKTRALEEQNAQIQQQSKELSESQHQLEQKAKELELASKYKSEFLANMSHELRTPLNSLLILARILAANEQGNLTDEQIEEASIIYNGGLELLGLINDILDLSKIEAGKLIFTPEDTAVEGIMKRMQQQFTPLAKESGVSFPVIMETGLPITIHTDTHRVEQILKNLLSNAFKFTGTGSVTLKVHRPAITLDLQRTSLAHENAIAFSVIDTGIGIDTSKFKDIFEAFQQEDGSIDRHYGGTGLGLTIARKFAHMLGGEIHVVSEKGNGSSFTLVLPLWFAQETQELQAIETAPHNTSISVKPMPRTWAAEFIPDDRKNISDKDKVMLIIEDDAGFATALVKIARRHGYKCIAAGDGKTGLLYAAEQKVTAIILDLTLPDIDGMNVLDQLKHSLKTRYIPVHIISGREAVNNIVPLSKGAIGYLAKPAGKEAIDEVFTRIGNLLEASVKHVLVVEDDKKNQVAIETLLKKKDVRITLASLGSIALIEMKNTRFDCIILDLRLPDMTGFEWLKLMEKQAGKNQTPPVIIYTAKELTEEENRQLSHYTDSIIIKGAKSPERLLDEVTLFLHSVESTLSKDQQEMIRMQHHPDKVLQGRTILLTDDDLRNTFALSKLLKGHGMNIVIADNGQMAMDKLKENSNIELVIMDIMMPVMDGYQAMREIRSQPSTRNLPIIALTARAMPDEQEKCMAAGANDYLTKPVDIERLLTLLRVWLFKQEMAA